jgi:ornithine cyclodeaminase/alanine dehydrogenase-like protein (mu-crystallin family)
MTEARFLFLSQEDVVAAGGLDMPETIEVVEYALRLHGQGDAVLPRKVSIFWGDDPGTEELEGRVMAMPAYVGGDLDVVGLKWIPSVPDNPTRGLPRGIGLIVLSDRTTGLPLAVLDGTVVSAMRTGAVTGIAVRALANPGSRVATILGAGVQARTQLMALHSVLDLAEVRVWDIDPERARAFCEQEVREGVAMLPVESAREACLDVPVVVAATMAPEPFVPLSWISEGAIFVSISSLDPMLDLVAGSDVLVCDVWEHESGHASRPFARALEQGLVSRERVAQLGEVLLGIRPGRTDPSQRVFVSPVGLAIEDVAGAVRVYRRAEELGIGTPLALWRDPLWS